MTFTGWFAAKVGRIVRFAVLLALFTTPLLPTQAQDDDRAGAPGKLSSETTEDGLVLSWEAPDLDGEQITGYEIEALHVRRGTGIVLEVTGITDGETTIWTDLGATDPELLYVYRVRALFGEDAGRWSSFMITGLESESDADDGAEAEATAVPPGLPVEPTAVPPEAEPTRAGHVEPTAVSAPPRQSGPTSVAPVAELEPTPALPEPEATALVPLPQAEPTAAGAEAEPTPSP